MFPRAENSSLKMCPCWELFSELPHALLSLGFFCATICASSTGWTLVYSLYPGADFQHHRDHLCPLKPVEIVSTVNTSLSSRLRQIYLPLLQPLDLTAPGCYYSVGLVSLIPNICLNPCFATLSLPYGLNESYKHLGPLLS